MFFKNIWVQKHYRSIRFWVPKNVGWKKNECPNKFNSQQIVSHNKNLGLKNDWGENIVCPKKLG